VTLLPVEQVRISVPPQDRWPTPEIARLCQVPGCLLYPEPGAHHVVRRTFTGGPVDWVTIDGLVLYNLVRLCHRHHSALTEHHAGIRHEEGTGWVWFTEATGGHVRPQDDGVALAPRTGRLFVRVGPVVVSGDRSFDALDSGSAAW